MITRPLDRFSATFPAPAITLLKQAAHLYPSRDLEVRIGYGTPALPDSSYTLETRTCEDWSLTIRHILATGERHGYLTRHQTPLPTTPFPGLKSAWPVVDQNILVPNTDHVPWIVLNNHQISAHIWHDPELWTDREYRLFEYLSRLALEQRELSARSLAAHLLDCPATWDCILHRIRQLTQVTGV